MAPQSFWKGYLKLSLVTCPVAMTPAVTDSARVKFHTLNRATGNRVQSRYVDAASGHEVAPENQARAYQTAEDRAIILEDDEIEAVALPSTRTIDIETFVPRDSIAWIWYDRAHYLTPADPVGEEAFCVIRDAMAATKTVGIARLVLYRRERAIMLAPRHRGIIVWTLRYGDEVRDQAAYLTAIPTTKPDGAMLKLIGKLIDQRTVPWAENLVRDPVQDNLQKIIAAKRGSRRTAKTAPAVQHTSNVINITEALRRSLESESRTK